MFRQHARPVFDKPLASEMVRADEIRPGDTVIHRNSHNCPSYRVVGESKADSHNEGMWLHRFDTVRDVPGPGMDHTPTNIVDCEGGDAGREVERVTELPEGFVMTRIARVQELDYVQGVSRDERHVVWQVARQVDSQERVLVRFARDDDFMRFERLGQDVYLVRPHRRYR